MRVGLTTLAIALLPTQAAFSDLGALLAHQPGVTARAHQFVLSSPFGTIHAATFSMPRPIGTAIPHPPLYALANFDPGDIAAPIGAEWLGDPNAPLQFPTVNRKDKSDSLAHRARKAMPPLPPLLAIPPLPSTQVDAAFKADRVNDRIDPYTQYEFGGVVDEPQDVLAASPAVDNDAPVKDATIKRVTVAPSHKNSQETARIFFNGDPLVTEQEEITPWAPGYAPTVKQGGVAGDPDLKVAALDPSQIYDDLASGSSIANKGEVTGADQHPESPAERLGLTGAKRAKQEKCLANAVYFEARGEPVRGQIAVAQVVMNRVFSPFYPKTICGVVYQNANRHLACQFTFACDGVPDVVTEPEAWERAKRIAHDMLDGKLWMPQIAKSTHYHAYWVHPSWVGEMRKMFKIGVHTFYRPRAWGDGSDEPSWGDPKTTAKETKLIKNL